MNPRNKSEFKRLVTAVRDSYHDLSPFRKKRTELIKAFVGSDYGDANVKEVYIYFLSMALNIYVRQLAVRAPTANITTSHAALRPTAKDFSLACEDAARDVGLGVTLRRIITDSMFSPMAIAKMGLEYDGQQEYSGEMVDVTKPFVRKVSFDDFVTDMSAKSAYDPAFMGDRYYIPRQELMDRYGSKLKGIDITPDDLGVHTEDGGERAESMAHRESATGNADLRSRVALQDIWLPDTRELVTYLVAKPERALDVISFDTMEEGPYRRLWYTDVPDNAMPMVPFSTLRMIHELANSLFRRLALQARKQKRVAGFSDEESAIRFTKAHDGDGIHWDGQKPEEISIGGIDQVNLAMFIQVKDLFSWTAGNLDTLGGLSPMAETATQEGMLAQGANAALADMQDAATEFTRSIFRQLAWYEWTDPVRTRILQKELPGLNDYIAVEWNAETREGDFLDFNFDINPHSMREDSPATKVGKLQGVITNFFGQLMPFFQQQGLTVDVKRMTQLVADYTNLPELEQLIVPVDPSMMQQEPGAQPQGNPMPAVTTRNYVRTNRPGATRTGKDAATVQALVGGAPQPAEMAAIGRPSS